jgi:hypothetical protein
VHSPGLWPPFRRGTKLGAAESSLSSLASRFTCLVLLGVGLGLPSADYGVEVEAGRTGLLGDGVGGAALVVLGHLKAPALLLPCLHQADLGERRVVMQYDGEGMLAPFLVVPL